MLTWKEIWLLTGKEVNFHAHYEYENYSGTIAAFPPSSGKQSYTVNSIMTKDNAPYYQQLHTNWSQEYPTLSEALQRGEEMYLEIIKELQNE